MPSYKPLPSLTDAELEEIRIKADQGGALAWNSTTVRLCRALQAAREANRAWERLEPKGLSEEERFAARCNANDDRKWTDEVRMVGRAALRLSAEVAYLSRKIDLERVRADEQVAEIARLTAALAKEPEHE